ncbi:MAG TPA: protein kinase [Blastocatellia bacterium]|nr:protein kinase [Blastocatellia bacterium]
MSITAGARLGPYEILAPLGAGGMGEVWRARDTRFNREVAIKLLPASLANDPDRLRRFELEALATSALNHPNILTIHDIGTAPPELGGAPYIVTELLTGSELRAQLPPQSDTGPLPARTAIDYAQQIAAGLAAAHEKGIVHRDLKPENLFVTTQGRVKILDFGLAKLKLPQLDDAKSQAPTRQRLTDPGVVMGTVGYMSPEQVRGQEADHRADIFSFGVILYEMLSGTRAFDGDSAVEVMNAILKEDPPELTAINHRVPQGLERLVRRCMEKKPEHRFHSAHDLGYALEALSTSSGPRLETQPALAVAAEGTRRLFGRAPLPWVAAGVLALVTVGVIWAYFARQPMPDRRVMRFSVLPPEKSSFSQIALSPDGRQLAFTATTGGKLGLWVRPLDAMEAKAVPGTQDAVFPFWSPDSRFIAFFSGNRLKKVDVAGGPVQTLCEVEVPLGGAWSRAGVILFCHWPIGLSRISATGGEPAQVTTCDKARQEFAHIYPAFLPDGQHFLYTISSELKETRGTYLGSLDGTVKRRLLDEHPAIRYVTATPNNTGGGQGWLVFARDHALLAQTFDARRLEFTGDPFSLSDSVGSDIVTANYATFGASDNGVLVFDPNPNRKRKQYIWVDRQGQQIKSLEVEAGVFQHWLSPDEKRFIADRVDPQTGTYDLWQYDVSGGNAARFTFDPQNDFNPVWSPDGSRIVWASTLGGTANLYVKAANLAGEPVLLLKTDNSKIPTDWSLDGRFIIYSELDQKTKSDVWALPMTNGASMTTGSAAKPFVVVQTEGNDGEGRLSPDGRWLAYVSDVSGTNEVYIQSFPAGGGKRQISTSGGNNPRWRRDGREMFYYAGDGKLMAVPVRSDAQSFESEAAVPLFEFRAGPTPGFPAYAVTADGQRFLINAIQEPVPNAPLTVVVNWTAELKK